MSGYEIVNVPCIAYGFSFFCCTPLAYQFLVCIPNAWQTFRIRRIGDLGGTWAADCTKTWLCPCCSLIQNEKESKLLIEGRRTGFWGGDGAGAGAEDVVVQQPSEGLGEEMVMPTVVQDGGVTSAVAKLPAIMEGVDEQPVGSEADAELEKTDDAATETRPHTDGIIDSCTAFDPIMPGETFSNHTFTPPTMVCSVATMTVFEIPIPHYQSPPTESITTPQHFEIAPAQESFSYAPSHSERTKKKWNSDTTGQRTRRKSERVVPNHLDCFVPYMRFLD